MASRAKSPGSSPIESGISSQNPAFIACSSGSIAGCQSIRGDDAAFEVVTAADTFGTPTKRVNELWQTEFTYIKIQGWGWYDLSTVLDDFSRYILALKLTSPIATSDVLDTLELALKASGLKHARVRHRPRLLSDNGPAYLSKELREYMEAQDIEYTRGAPFHPMTQGKIERDHRSVKNIVLLENYFIPEPLE